MNVLVAVASKHGSTTEIGAAIADELRAMGLNAEPRDYDEIANLDHYEAAVLGSAIYMGNWLAEAREFVTRNGTELRAMPVWLFSSGPLGDPPVPADEPAGVVPLIEATGAKGHRVFAGELDPSELGLKEKLATKLVKAPAGDYRDWDAIRAWAREIGTALERGQDDG
jgi:menaquinone-dependent protoporphyrinogen oxidase